MSTNWYHRPDLLYTGKRYGQFGEIVNFNFITAAIAIGLESFGR
jgi:hypothetical protein